MRWLVIALVAYVLYKLVTNEMPKRAQDTQAARDATAGEMVKDPVCGVYVDASSSVRVRDGALVHHFCSFEFRDSFLEQLRATGRNIPKKEE